jgi:hypothetical protein
MIREEEQADEVSNLASIYCSPRLDLMMSWQEELVVAPPGISDEMKGKKLCKLVFGQRRDCREGTSSLFPS